MIASEVFEHAPPPAEKAFANLHALLKPGGFCVFTVPYANDGVTREHFPDLFEFRVESRGDEKVLIDKTRDGAGQVFKDLNFHGGKVTTLEMRLFALDSLHDNFSNAGFISVAIHRESYPGFGICQDSLSSSFTIIACRR